MFLNRSRVSCEYQLFSIVLEAAARRADNNGTAERGGDQKEEELLAAALHRRGEVNIKSFVVAGNGLSEGST